MHKLIDRTFLFDCNFNVINMFFFKFSVLGIYFGTLIVFICCVVCCTYWLQRNSPNRVGFWKWVGRGFEGGGYGGGYGGGGGGVRSGCGGEGGGSGC